MDQEKNFNSISGVANFIFSTTLSLLLSCFFSAFSPGSLVSHFLLVPFHQHLNMLNVLNRNLEAILYSLSHFTSDI